MMDTTELDNTNREDTSPAAKVSYLRLAVTGDCDLRCIYCAPYRRAVSCAASPISADDVRTLVDAFARSGVTKVRLTGGEPLQRQDIADLVRLISRTRGIRTVGLTTNGVRLPRFARDLADAGLDLVNISLDTLDRSTFERITGRDCLGEVLCGIEAALSSGVGRVKINTVVMRGVNEEQVSDIADIGDKLPVEVRFIELMPVAGDPGRWRRMHVSAAQIRARLGDLEPLPREPGSSARLYRRKETGATLGIISPVTEHFCADCNRMRLTPSGKLKPCLRLPMEEDIGPLLEAPDPAAAVRDAIERLAPCKFSVPLSAGRAVGARAMSLIGG